MYKRIGKPFFFSTLATLLLLVVFTVAVLLLPVGSYAGYSVWWVMSVPLLGALLSVLSALCYVRVKGIGSCAAAGWSLFYNYYAVNFILVAVLLAVMLTVLLWGFSLTVYSPLVLLAFWVICMLSSLLFALVFLLIRKQLAKGKKHLVVLGILLLAVFGLSTYMVAGATVYVFMVGEAGREYNAGKENPLGNEVKEVAFRYSTVK